MFTFEEKGCSTLRPFTERERERERESEREEERVSEREQKKAGQLMDILPSPSLVSAGAVFACSNRSTDISLTDGGGRI